jgi:hypothetical protein
MKVEPWGCRVTTTDLSGRPSFTFAELSTVVDFNMEAKFKERRVQSTIFVCSGLF